jgi:hypothetical protein
MLTDANRLSFENVKFLSTGCDEIARYFLHYLNCNKCTSNVTLIYKINVQISSFLTVYNSSGEA